MNFEDAIQTLEPLPNMNQDNELLDFTIYLAVHQL